MGARHGTEASRASRENSLETIEHFHAPIGSRPLLANARTLHWLVGQALRQSEVAMNDSTEIDTRGASHLLAEPHPR